MDCRRSSTRPFGAPTSRPWGQGRRTGCQCPDPAVKSRGSCEEAAKTAAEHCELALYSEPWTSSWLSFSVPPSPFPSPFPKRTLHPALRTHSVTRPGAQAGRSWSGTDADAGSVLAARQSSRRSEGEQASRTQRRVLLLRAPRGGAQRVPSAAQAVARSRRGPGAAGRAARPPVLVARRARAQLGHRPPSGTRQLRRRRRQGGRLLLLEDRRARPQPAGRRRSPTRPSTRPATSSRRKRSKARRGCSSSAFWRPTRSGSTTPPPTRW